MSQICPQCGNDLYATSAEHRCSDFVMPYMCKTTSIDPRDAQIATLTERLRIVEAERDEVKRKNVIFRGAQKACDDCDAPTMREVENMRAQLSALRAELDRKDAALRRLESASVAVDKAWHYEARQGDGIMEEHEPQELELQMALIDARAALQPKEPPCQTA